MREALPAASKRDRAIAANVVMMSMGATAEAITEQGQSRAAVSALASAMGDMFCAYLDRLNAKGKVLP